MNNIATLFILGRAEEMLIFCDEPNSNNHYKFMRSPLNIIMFDLNLLFFFDRSYLQNNYREGSCSFQNRN